MELVFDSQAQPKEAGRGPNALHWAFTLNNYVSLLDPSEIPNLAYCIYQEEVGDSGTPHLQGYLQFTRKQRGSQLRKIEQLAGAHFEPARGSLAENKVYCSKEEGRLGGPYEWGEAITTGQGARSDLLRVKRLIDDGATHEQMWDAEFNSMVRYHKSFTVYKRVKTPRRNHQMTVFLFVGTPGTGKTRTAVTLAQFLGSYYMVPPSKGSGLYWDDYDGQETVIIDEMDGNRMTPTFFNLLLDRYPLEVPVHGSAGHQFTSKYIIICSNFMPSQWWKKGTFNLAALERRVTRVVKFIYAPAPLLSGPDRAGGSPTFRYNNASQPLIPFFSEHL